MTAFAKAIYQFHFDQPAVEQLKQLIPLDVNKLAIDTAINNWGPMLKERLPSMRGKLLQDNGIPHPDKLGIIDQLERTFLFDGYKEYFTKLVPRDSEIVLAHNDAQENNILASLEDNSKITLIDYEYGGWNPMAMDIANYLNEFMLDNNHPKGSGIKFYINNFASNYECNSLMKDYLRCYYGDRKNNPTSEDNEKFVKQHLPQFKREVEACLLLSNFCWGVWALAMLSDTDICNETVYNYEFASSRVEMYKRT